MIQKEAMVEQKGRPWKPCWRWTNVVTLWNRWRREQSQWSLTLRGPFERVQLKVVFENQRRALLEECALDQLQTIMAIFPRSKWLVLLLGIVMLEAMREVLTVYPQLTLKVYDGDIQVHVCSNRYQKRWASARKSSNEQSCKEVKKQAYRIKYIFSSVTQKDLV